MISSTIVALVLAGVPVVGEVACPAASEVQALVGRLSPDTAPSGTAAHLDQRGDVVHLSLRDAQGTIVFERDLPSGRPCDQLAEIAALFLVGWLSEPAPQVSQAERLPPPAPILPPTPWRWELAAGASGSLSSSGVAPGARLSVEAGPSQSLVALSVSALYDGPRQAPLGPGKVSWQSVLVGLGPTYALTRLPLRLEVGGDLTLTAQLLHGESFPTNSAASSWNPGVDLDARLVALQGDWHLWLGLWVNYWIRQEFPVVSGLTAQASLPQWEGLLGLGGAWSIP